jgi:alpha-ketoglutarate-dependent taurine dioxygenase
MSRAVTDATIHRLSPALGAEVLGIDLAHPVDPATVTRVRDAFQEHHLLCFREQRLTDDELMAFLLLFGPLEGFPEKDKTTTSRATPRARSAAERSRRASGCTTGCASTSASRGSATSTGGAPGIW